MFAQADCVYAACALKVYRRSLSPATLLVFSFLASSTLSPLLSHSLPSSPAISFAKIFLVSALKFHWSACRLCKHGSLLFLRSSIYSRVLQRIYAAAASSLCVCVWARVGACVCVCVSISKLWSLNANKTFACLSGVLRQFLCVPSFAYFNACDELSVPLSISLCLSVCLFVCTADKQQAAILTAYCQIGFQPAASFFLRPAWQSY